MNGRSIRIRQWLDNISNDLLNIYEIFNNKLITVEDIGALEMSIIKDDLEHLLTVIDDVIFKLEN
jgi:hypothetical protein